MNNVAYIVLDYFKNDSRVLKQGRSLISAGYNVTIYCLHKNGLAKREIIDSILVKRIKLFSNVSKRSGLAQIVQYIEFFFRLLFTIRKTDIINASSVAPLPIAVFIKLLHFGKIKIVYDARELESERNDLVGLKKKVFSTIERKLIRFADEVTTVSDSIAEEYRKKYNIKKPKLIINCPPLSIVEKSRKFHEVFNLDNETKVFLYQGVFGKGRGIEVMIEAFKNLKNEKIALVLMGYGAMENEVKKASHENSNIFYHQAVSPDELLQYTACADVGLTLIENSSLSYYYCLPNKFFEYAMAGLPILSTNLLELQMLVTKYQCGILINDVSIEECISGIKRILRQDLSQLGNNARKMAEEYCWENQEKILIDTYRNLTS